MACLYRINHLFTKYITDPPLKFFFFSYCYFPSIRASRSLDLNFSTADYEAMMTKTVCQEAYRRAKSNLESIKDTKFLEIDGNLKSLAEDICSSGGVVQSHPLGF